jgi:hydroxypyruvate isomerase
MKYRIKHQIYHVQKVAGNLHINKNVSHWPKNAHHRIEENSMKSGK